MLIEYTDVYNYINTLVLTLQIVIIYNILIAFKIKIYTTKLLVEMY